MAVYDINHPFGQLPPVNGVRNRHQEQAIPDDEDIATELWMSTIGHSLEIATIELLIAGAPHFPPATEVPAAPEVEAFA